MIEMRLRAEGASWLATANVGGLTYEAKGPRGTVALALARQLVDAGIPDQSVHVETHGSIRSFTTHESLDEMARGSAAP